MREISRSALVPQLPAQIFALVDDCERYPEFVPWVSGAKLLEQTATERTARLEMSRAGLHEQFTTRNTVSPPGRLEMRLVDGPFRVLEGVWTFDAIGAQSQGESQGEVSASRGTRITLTLRFEFKSRITEMLLASKVASSCDTLVDAFVKRAREIYGPARTS